MRGREFAHGVPHPGEPLGVAGGLDRADEGGVELVGAERVGQLAEVHFEERGDRVDVLEDALVRVEGRHAVLVEGVPQPLDVGADAAEPVYAVDEAVALDEVGAAAEHAGHLLAGVEQVLAEVAAEDALAQDARLLEPAARGPVQDERAEEGDELAVLAQHRLHGLEPGGLEPRGLLQRGGRARGREREADVPGQLVADDGDALGREEADGEAVLAAPPGALARRRHVYHGDHVAHLEGDLVLGLGLVGPHGVRRRDRGRVDGAGVGLGHEDAPAPVVQLQPVEHRAAVEALVAQPGEAAEVVAQPLGLQLALVLLAEPRQLGELAVEDAAVQLLVEHDEVLVGALQRPAGVAGGHADGEALGALLLGSAHRHLCTRGSGLNGWANWWVKLAD